MYFVPQFIYVPSESHCSLSVVPFDDLSSIVPSSSKNMSIISSNVIVDGVTVDASSSSTATVSVSVFPPVPLPSHSAAIQSTSDPASSSVPLGIGLGVSLSVLSEFTSIDDDEGTATLTLCINDTVQFSVEMLMKYSDFESMSECSDWYVFSDETASSLVSSLIYDSVPTHRGHWVMKYLEDVSNVSLSQRPSPVIIFHVSALGMLSVFMSLNRSDGSIPSISVSMLRSPVIQGVSLSELGGFSLNDLSSPIVFVMNPVSSSSDSSLSSSFSSSATLSRLVESPTSSDIPIFSCVHGIWIDGECQCQAGFSGHACDVCEAGKYVNWRDRCVSLSQPTDEDAFFSTVSTSFAGITGADGMSVCHGQILLTNSSTADVFISYGLVHEHELCGAYVSSSHTLVVWGGRVMGDVHVEYGGYVSVLGQELWVEVNEDINYCAEYLFSPASIAMVEEFSMGIHVDNTIIQCVSFVPSEIPIDPEDSWEEIVIINAPGDSYSSLTVNSPDSDIPPFDIATSFSDLSTVVSLEEDDRSSLNSKFVNRMLGSGVDSNSFPSQPTPIPLLITLPIGPAFASHVYVSGSDLCFGGLPSLGSHSAFFSAACAVRMTYILPVSDDSWGVELRVVGIDSALFYSGRVYRVMLVLTSPSLDAAVFVEMSASGLIRVFKWHVDKYLSDSESVEAPISLFMLGSVPDLDLGSSLLLETDSVSAINSYTEVVPVRSMDSFNDLIGENDLSFSINRPLVPNITYCAHGTLTIEEGSAICECDDRWRGDSCDTCSLAYWDDELGGCTHVNCRDRCDDGRCYAFNDDAAICGCDDDTQLDIVVSPYISRSLFNHSYGDIGDVSPIFGFSDDACSIHSSYP
ncbi:hypothetical protein ADUPG1_007949, partial [Aduncisulcus paluster]